MKKNEKTSKANNKQTTNNKKNEVMKQNKALKTVTVEKIQALAIELGRKVSKNDLAGFACAWQTDKQGRAQSLLIDGKLYRTDNRIFYPNCEKPKTTGKHLHAAARVCWSVKVFNMFETMQKAAAALGVDFAAAGIHSIEQAAAALDEAAAKIEAAKVEAAAAKHTEKLNKAAARFSVADLEKMLEARKAASNA